MMHKKFRIFRVNGDSVTDWLPLNSFDTQEEAEEYLEKLDQKGTFVILSIYKKEF